MPHRTAPHRAASRFVVERDLNTKQFKMERAERSGARRRKEIGVFVAVRVGTWRCIPLLHTAHCTVQQHEEEEEEEEEEEKTILSLGIGEIINPFTIRKKERKKRER